MRRIRLLALLTATLFAVTSCGDDSSTSGVEISVRYDRTVDFTQYQTFSVVTEDLVDPPDLDDDQAAFNNEVNQLIVEAMQAAPVCLTLIPPDEVSEDNQPDLWAANGLARSSEGGYFYECVGGWWWGWWGWWWDPCKWWVPRYVEIDIGTLLIAVGPPPGEDQEVEPNFAGLAQAIVASPPFVDSRVEEAVQAIFSQWPDQRVCDPQ